MDYRQTVSNIKDFLNSSNLTDTETARELYYAYLVLNKSACARLNECELLLQKHDKYAAMAVAQQQPELFALLDDIMFPQRELLKRLAFFYDWTPLEEIYPERILRIKGEVSGTKAFLPLVAEYQNIAGQGNLRKEISLLKAIIEQDKNESKWQILLRSVEERYAYQLIFDAKKAISVKDYPLLMILHDELMKIVPNVSVPESDFSDITLAVKKFLTNEDARHIDFLLDNLRKAHAARDVSAIENALIAWDFYRKQNKAVLNPTDLQLYNDASAFVAQEKMRHTAQTTFKKHCTELSESVDNCVPAGVVRKHLEFLQNSNFNIPEELLVKVEEYLKKRRKIFAVKLITAIILAPVIAAGVCWAAVTVTDKLEKRARLEHIKENLQVADYTEIQRAFTEIAAEHPELLDHPDVVNAENAVKRAQDAEFERSNRFKRLLRNIKNAKAEWAFDETVKDRIKQLSAIAKNSEEKELVDKLRHSYSETVEQQRRNAKREFANKVTELNSYRDRIMFFMQRRDFAAAESELRSFKHMIEHLKNIHNVQGGEFKEHQEVVNSYHILEKMLQKVKQRDVQLSETMAGMLAATDINQISMLIDRLSNLTSDRADNLHLLCQKLSADVNAFKGLLHVQSIPGRDVRAISGSALTSGGLYIDKQKFSSIREAEVTAKKRLVSAFEEMCGKHRKNPLCFVRFKEEATDRYIDVYVQNGAIAELHNEINMSSENNEPVKVLRIGSHFHVYEVRVGNRKYSRCTLAYPTVMSTRRIRESKARHQTLAEFINEDLKNVSPEELTARCAVYFEMVMRDTLCDPLWKIRISDLILRELAPLDLVSGRFISQINGQMDKLMRENNRSNIMKYISNFNFSDFSKMLSKNAIQYKLHKEAADNRFEFFGIVFDNKIKITPEMEKKTGYILCFDETKNKCMLFGHFDGKKFVYSQTFSVDKGTRLLFRAVKNINYKAVSKELCRDLGKVNWPHCWPVNCREVSE